MSFLRRPGSAIASMRSCIRVTIRPAVRMYSSSRGDLTARSQLTSDVASTNSASGRQRPSTAWAAAE